jgi:hypothetical protein
MGSAIFKAVEALKRPRYNGHRVRSSPFAGLRHTLKDLEDNHLSTLSTTTEPATKDAVEKLLRNLILECTPYAAILSRVMLKLGDAEQRVREGRMDLVPELLLWVRTEIKSLEESPRAHLYELCDDHKIPSKPAAFALDWRIIDHQRPNSPSLLFDLGDLRMTIAALRANAHSAKTDQTQCYLCYDEVILSEPTRQAEITWLEATEWPLINAKPCKNRPLAAILKAIGKSAAERGLQRGLPQVLLFGVENNAASVEILLGGQWHVAWSRPGFKPTVRPICEYNMKANYGWRFVFVGESQLENAPVLDGNAGDYQQGHQEDVKDLKVFLIDDNPDAPWLDHICKRLSDRGFAVEKRVAIAGKIKECANDIRTATAAKKCLVVTDSMFGREKDAGGQLLAFLLESPSILRRGLVYSEDPFLQNALRRAGDVECFSKNSADYPADAFQIEHYLLTGKLDPLGSLFEMMRRLAATIKHIFATITDPPSAFDVDRSPWRALVDPWCLLASGLGDRIPTPFSAQTWQSFTDEPFLIAFNGMLEMSGIRSSALRAEWIAALRRLLCPVGSVVEAVDTNLTKPWRNPRGSGALRVMWDIATARNGFPHISESECVDWLESTTRGISHRDVRLKYIHYMQIYRRRILCAVTIDDWPEICKSVQTQISSLIGLLAKLPGSK